MYKKKDTNKYLPEDKELFILITMLVVIGVSLGASFIHFFIHLQENIEVIKSVLEMRPR